jgi:hypothetical protein
MTAYVDNQTIEGLTSTQAYRLQITTQATAASTLTLSATSTGHQYFTGSTAGQIVKMPDATTLLTGHEYWIINDATVAISLQDNGGGSILSLDKTRRAKVVLQSNGTAAGTWLVAQVAGNTNPVGGLFIANFSSTANSNSNTFLNTFGVAASDTAPAVIPITGTVSRVTIMMSGTGTGTFEFRVNTSVGAAAFTAAITSAQTATVDVSYAVTANDRINCKIASGATGIAKPNVNIYM